MKLTKAQRRAKRQLQSDLQFAVRKYRNARKDAALALARLITVSDSTEWNIASAAIDIAELIEREVR